MITNQPDVERGLNSEKNISEINSYLKNKLYLDDLFVCFSDDDRCYDRKPNPGMLIKAINKWNINIKTSYFIGDSLSDFKASKKINLKFFYKTKESLLKQVKNIIC